MPATIGRMELRELWPLQSYMDECPPIQELALAWMKASGFKREDAPQEVRRQRHTSRPSKPEPQSNEVMALAGLGFPVVQKKRKRMNACPINIDQKKKANG